MNHNSALVTTSSSIEGWEIQEHLGVVVAHAVAGTGLISDILAGFTDVFGGRSESYRRQLHSLYQEAIGELLRQARTRGGNWLIGLKLDIDEVSGKGTQMFMITGLATAVRAKKVLTTTEATISIGTAIEPTELHAMFQRLALLRRMKGEYYYFDDPAWAFCIENRVTEAAETILAHLSRQDGSQTDFRRKSATYFSALPRDDAMRILYDALKDEKLCAAAIGLICDCRLGSYDRVLKIMAGLDAQLKRNAIQTLSADQPSYNSETLSEIDALRPLMLAGFPDLSTSLEKKGLIGPPKQLWQCPCGKVNSRDDRYCSSCERDVYGFANRAMSLADAIESLDNTRTALAAVMAGREAL